MITNERSGALLARLSVEPRHRLELRYRHSMYRRPATEEFTVDAHGLTLRRLSSPSVAVLEYYERTEPVHPSASGYEIVVRPERFPSIRVLAGSRGSRTVVYGRHVIPLHLMSRDGDPIQISVTPRVETRGAGAPPDVTA